MKCEKFECKNWDKNICLKEKEVFITDMGKCGLFDYADISMQEIEERKEWQFNDMFGDLLK